MSTPVRFNTNAQEYLPNTPNTQRTSTNTPGTTTPAPTNPTTTSTTSNVPTTPATNMNSSTTSGAPRPPTSATTTTGAAGASGTDSTITPQKPKSSLSTAASSYTPSTAFTPGASSMRTDAAPFVPSGAPAPAAGAGLRKPQGYTPTTAAGMMAPPGTTYVPHPGAYPPPDQYGNYGQPGGPRHSGAHIHRPPHFFNAPGYAPQGMYVQPIGQHMMAPSYVPGVHTPPVPLTVPPHLAGIPGGVIVAPIPMGGPIPTAPVGASPRTGPVPVAPNAQQGTTPHAGPRGSPGFIPTPTTPSVAAAGGAPAAKSGTSVPSLSLADATKPQPPTSATTATPVAPTAASAAATPAPASTQAPATPAAPQPQAPAQPARAPEETPVAKPSAFDAFATAAANAAAEKEKAAAAAAAAAAAEKEKAAAAEKEKVAAAEKEKAAATKNDEVKAPTQEEKTASVPETSEEKKSVVSSSFLANNDSDEDEDGDFDEDEDEDTEDIEDDFPEKPVFDIENNRYSREQMLALREFASAPDVEELSNAAKMISEILTLHAPKTRPSGRPRNEEWRNAAGATPRRPAGRRSGKRGMGMDTSDLPQLSTCENAYKINRDVEGDERKLRDLQSILNKLTAQNLDKLSRDACNIQIDNDDLMGKCVNLVFQKAIKEPNFSPTYADFCRRLADVKLESTTEGGSARSFRQLILMALQTSFQSRQFATPEEFASMTPEQQQEEIQKKKDILGTIRFVGELFIRGMIKVRIMYDCLDQLLPTADKPIIEEDLEVLCKLLTTIGSTLALNRSPAYDKTFERMRELSQDKVLSTRLRFMLMDVLDLERNNWQEVIRAPAPAANKGGDKGSSGAGGAGSADRYKRRGTGTTLSRASSGIPASSTPVASQPAADEWVMAGDKKRGGARGTRGSSVAGSSGSMSLSRSQSSVVSPRVGKDSGAGASASTKAAGKPATPEDTTTAPPSAAATVPEVETEGKTSEEDSANVADLEERVTRILRIFIKDDNDLHDACQQLSQLPSNAGNGVILSEGFKLVSGAKQNIRELYQHLLSDLLVLKCANGQPVLKHNLLVPVLPNLLASLTDMVIDIPIVFSNFAECIRPLLTGDMLSFDDFTSDDVFEAFNEVLPPMDALVKLYGELAIRMGEKAKPALRRLPGFIARATEQSPTEVSEMWTSLGYSEKLGELPAEDA